MSQPPDPYERSFNFTDFQSASPNTPLPGQKVDQELNNVRQSLNDTIDRLNEIQRDDGKIRDSALNLDTIGEAVSNHVSQTAVSAINAAGTTQVTAVNAAGASATAAVEAASASGVADLEEVINSTAATAAVNAAENAAASATSAAASAAGAASAASNSSDAAIAAAGSAGAAATHASEAAFSAGQAAISASTANNKALLAASSANDATNQANISSAQRQLAQEAAAQALAARNEATTIVEGASEVIIAGIEGYLADAQAAATAAETSKNSAETAASDASSAASYAAASASDANTAKTAAQSAQADAEDARDAALAAAASIDPATLMHKSANLSDVASVASARSNLGVYSSGETDSAISAYAYPLTNPSGYVAGADLTVTLGDYLPKSGNLDGLTDLTTARGNLGLGTMATATASDYLPKSGNLSGLASASAARSNLGLGTMAVETASNYPTIASIGGTNSVAALLYANAASQTNPFGTIGDINSAVNSYAASVTSTYAPLSSPNLTDNPTAPTQSAGNNSTRLATTAFVGTAITNLGLTSLATASFATVAQVKAFSSTTAVMSPYLSSWMAGSSNVYSFASFSSIVSGTGAAVTTLASTVGSIEITGPNASTAGYAAAHPGGYHAWNTGNTNAVSIDFAKRARISAKVNITSGWQGDANNHWKLYLGGTDTGGAPNGGYPVAGCIGVRRVGGNSTTFDLMVHNNTSITYVPSSVIPVVGRIYELVVESDGSGNATLFVDGVSVATSTSAPTGLVGTAYCTSTIGQTASAATRYDVTVHNVKVITS